MLFQALKWLMQQWETLARPTGLCHTDLTSEFSPFLSSPSGLPSLLIFPQSTSLPLIPVETTNSLRFAPVLQVSPSKTTGCTPCSFFWLHQGQQWAWISVASTPVHWGWHGDPAAAKSLQSCPTLCNPIDSSPPGSSVHGIFQARVLEWVAISFSWRP